MKWLKEVYGLFVDGPKLAILALVALVISLLLSESGPRKSPDWPFALWLQDRCGTAQAMIDADFKALI